MFINTLLLVIIVVSLLAILIIILKKIPALKMIDLETITEEKEQQTKKKIIENRLLRKLGRLQQEASSAIRPVWKKTNTAFKNVYDKVLVMEKQYKDQQTATDKNPLSRQEQIQELIMRAEDFVKEEKYSEAEEKYIKAVEIDSRNHEIYKDLSELYIISKDFGKAEETLRYLVKLLKNKLDKASEENKHVFKHEIARAFENLGIIFQAIEDYKKAVVFFKKAAELEPNNPRFLDLLLKISIILKDKNLAVKTLKELKEADPENQKLGELEEEVRNLNKKIAKR